MSCLWRATTHNLALSFVQVFKFRIPCINGISANLGGSQMTRRAKNLPMPRGSSADATGLEPMPFWKSFPLFLRYFQKCMHLHNAVSSVSSVGESRNAICHLNDGLTGKKTRRFLSWAASLQGWVLCFKDWTQRSILDSCWPPCLTSILEHRFLKIF